MNSRVVVPLSWIRRVFIIIPFVSLAFNANCQSIARWVITPFGNSYDNNFQIVQATLGEPFVMTVTDSVTFFLTQGFQQPTPSELPKEYYTIEIKIYPNPVITECSVSFFVKDVTDFTIDVWNIVGKFIYKKGLSGVYSGQVEIIDFTYMPQGIYFVRVYSERDEMKKIEKIVKL